MQYIDDPGYHRTCGPIVVLGAQLHDPPLPFSNICSTRLAALAYSRPIAATFVLSTQQLWSSP